MELVSHEGRRAVMRFSNEDKMEFYNSEDYVVSSHDLPPLGMTGKFVGREDQDDGTSLFVFETPAP